VVAYRRPRPRRASCRQSQKRQRPGGHPFGYPAFEIRDVSAVRPACRSAKLRFETMTTPLLVWGHEAAFLAYAIFAVIVGMRGARTLQTLLFLLVMLATAAWAQAFVAVFLGYAP